MRGQLPDMPLHRGVVGDRDVLGLHDALLGVVDGEGERALRDARVHRGVAQREALHHAHPESGARIAERGVLRHAHAGEGHRGAEGRAHAQRVPLAVGGDTGSLRGQQHQRQRLGHVGAALERAPDHVVRGAQRHRAEVLHPVHHVGVAVLADGRLHQEGAGEAHRGLAAPAPEELAVAHDLAEVAALLGLRAERVDEAHDRGVHMHGHRGVGAAPREGADHADIGRHVQAEAAVGGGNARAQKAVPSEHAPGIDRVDARRVVLGRARSDVLPRQAVDPLEDGFLGRGVQEA